MEKKQISSRYKDTLQYLYRQLPMYQRIGPAAFKKDLGNIRALCKALDEPHHQFPAIHIAGTNGKGSTAHMLAAIFQSCGYKTGLYTSPHYKDFRERIKLNGQYIKKREVVEFVDQNRKLLEAIKPSFFEITVAMAFHHFARQQADMAIIETGLGGRLDSTNIITPLLSIITNISFDHQKMLGDTLTEIAGEKAGIIKAGVPVVIGQRQPEVAPIFEATAHHQQAPLTFANDHYRLLEIGQTTDAAFYDVYRDEQKVYTNLQLSTRGPFQHHNLATVLQGVEVLNNGILARPLSQYCIQQGLSDLQGLVRYQGRWQWTSRQPPVLCDSAHNEAGLKTVMQALTQLPCKQLHLVIGMVNDKDIGPLLDLLPQDARYYFARPAIPRGLDAVLLKEQAAAFGLHGKTYSSVRNALRAAKRRAAEADLIFVGGSTFVVAEVI